MNAHSQPKLSLIERAAQVYDFDAALRRRQADDFMLDADEAETLASAAPAMAPAEASSRSKASSGSHPGARARESYDGPASGTVDREALTARGFVLPDAPVGTLAEELRIVKRGLLAAVRAKGAGKGQVVMICSARPDDGKTFTAVNLAMSLAGERDIETLLIDGDVAKPEVLSTLGLEGGAGLVDALADPFVDVEQLVIRTDVGNLSVLPAGRQAHDATELLASGRMAELLRDLTSARAERVILFDSPPALAASAASAIAGHAGQVVMVVRADQTSEADLREAVGLVAGCSDIKLVLNGAAQPTGKKRFSYYGAGQ
ncbi:MAG TPA: AAA family ATPase [Sphingomonadaceae bacterium]|nr:AAA family ATPase [Sphingomonadaceae bacterium]